MRYKEVLSLSTLLLLSSVVVYTLTWSSPKNPPKLHAPVAAKVPSPPAKPDDFVALFAGDLALSESFHPKGEQNILRSHGYAYPFAKLTPLLTSAQLVLANLQTPILQTPPAEQENREERYWTSAEKASVVFKKQNITALSLANNHILDFGATGLRQTLNILDDLGIRHIGAGMNSFATKAPLRLEYPVGKLTFKLAVFAATMDGPSSDTIPLTKGETAQVNILDPAELAKNVQELRAKEPGLYIIAYLHWGKPYDWMEESQQKTARDLIDAGANLILGSGAHMMQQLERYKGRWILYGLGNFVFTSSGQYQKGKKAVPFSLIVRLVVNFVEDRLSTTLRVYPLHTDNKDNGYQGHLLSVKEIGDAYWPLLWRAYPYDKNIKRFLHLSQDHFGRHWVLDLDGAERGWVGQ